MAQFKKYSLEAVKELAKVKEILFEKITHNSVMVIKDSGDQYIIKKQDLVKLLKGE